jgi:hypothetical protein
MRQEWFDHPWERLGVDAKLERRRRGWVASASASETVTGTSLSRATVTYEYDDTRTCSCMSPY